MRDCWAIGKKWSKESIIHIADHEDAAPGPAFFQKVLDGVLFGNEQIVGEGVGEDAVDLLGHSAVKATEPGLDVSHADASFARREKTAMVELTSPTTRTRSGFAFDKTGSMPFQNFSGLRCVGARADFQVHLGEGMPICRKKMSKDFRHSAGRCEQGWPRFPDGAASRA